MLKQLIATALLAIQPSNAIIGQKAQQIIDTNSTSYTATIGGNENNYDPQNPAKTISVNVRNDTNSHIDAMRIETHSAKRTEFYIENGGTANQTPNETNFWDNVNAYDLGGNVNYRQPWTHKNEDNQYCWPLSTQLPENEECYMQDFTYNIAIKIEPILTILNLQLSFDVKTWLSYVINDPNYQNDALRFEMIHTTNASRWVQFENNQTQPWTISTWQTGIYGNDYTYVYNDYTGTKYNNSELVQNFEYWSNPIKYEQSIPLVQRYTNYIYIQVSLNENRPRQVNLLSNYYEPLIHDLIGANLGNTQYDLIYLSTRPTLHYDTAPNPSNPEFIDLPGLMFTIIGMPFSFISQAFNLTIFPGTPYSINFTNLFLSIIGILIFIFIMKIVIKMVK